MTTGQFEQYVAACGEPARARELAPARSPGHGPRRPAGERFRIEAPGRLAAPRPRDEPQQFRVHAPQPGGNLAAARLCMGGAKTLDRSAGNLPGQATLASWSEGFSPVNTTDPLPPCNQAARRLSTLPPLWPATSTD